MINGIINSILWGTSGGSSIPITSIGDIPFTWNRNQRSNAPVVLTSTVSESIAILNHIWIIYDSSGTVVDVNFGRTPNFDITAIGAYTIKYIVETATDSNYLTVEDAFYVHAPRFDIGDADLVIDFSTNADFYYDYTGVDKAGWKIAVTGVTSSPGHKIEFYNMVSSDPNNPVRIQAFGNTEVIGNSSVVHTWWMSGDFENVVIDGYKEDGTKGLSITNTATSGNTQLFRTGGRFKGLQLFGITTNHSLTRDAAALSLVGRVGSDSNASNYSVDNMAIYDCIGNNSGEEWLYANYNNDDPQSGNVPPQWANPLIAWNISNGSGRDSIQIGSAYDINMHHNQCYNWGQQMDSGGQTNAISWNGGSSGRCYKNFGYGGKVFLNIQSGNTPWAIFIGETVPRPNYFYECVFYQGDYSAWSGGSSEPVAVYIQNHANTGKPGPWNNYIWGCTFVCDKKGIEQYFHQDSFHSDDNTYVNNCFVVASASTVNTEYNFTGTVVNANAATTANVVLSGNQTIDGVVNPFAVLVRANTVQSQNGVYLTGAGAWTRVTTADSSSELNQLLVKVSGGTTYAWTLWEQTTPSPTVGVSDIVFVNKDSNRLLNNLSRIVGAESDLLFTTYTSPTGTNQNLKPSSFSSAVFSGSPTDIATRIPAMATYDSDYEGYPLIYSSAYAAFGAYSNNSARTVPYVPADASAATFSTPLAVGTLTQSGGTITFEANKQGRLFWVVVADGDAAPSKAQIRAGQNATGTAALDSGSILDLGTAASYVITSGAQGTSYDLYAVFVTQYGIEQAVATKVDYTTTSDVVAPTISTFVINDANKDRIYFNSSEVITASTVGGFTVATPTKTITSVTINAGQTTGHYFTVSVPFVYGETPTLAYSGSGSNLQDGSANALASFSATAITNNIAAGVAEPVVGYLNDDITVSGANSNEFTSTSTAASIESTQIIPSTSDGYIQFDWDQDTRNTSAIRIGFIAAADASPALNDVKLWLALNTANHNIDIYEGGTYKSTYNTFGYNNAGTKYRIIINRSTQKITALASNNNFSSSVTLYTSTTNFTGDFRFVFVTTVNGAQAMNCYIQADLGLT